MNPGSPPIDADAAPPAPPCPLCGQVRNHPKEVRFYTGYVCALCSERFIERRWMAFLIDMIALGIFWTAVGLILRAWTPGALMTSDLTELLLSPCLVAAMPCWPLPLMNVTARTGATAPLNLLIIVFFLLSLLCKDGYCGQSPGKAAFGLRVVYCRDLTPISFGASLKRNLVLLMPFYLGHITIAATLRERGRFGEGWVRTMVVEDRYHTNPIFSGTGRLCRACGYDLTGNVCGVCPECGTGVR